MDIGLHKTFVAGHNTRLQLRIEAFNAFNWVNLFNPTSNTNSANFGRVTTARGMRVVQLGAKWMF